MAGKKLNELISISWGGCCAFSEDEEVLVGEELVEVEELELKWVVAESAEATLELLLAFLRSCPRRFIPPEMRFDR